MRARPERLAPAPSVFVYVGPTLYGSERARAEIRAQKLRVRRPVRRQDIEKLVASERKPGVIVIVDGVFHDALAVGHAEIRDAIDAGWKVWGVSSMGAIRAREMKTVGMHGFGEVFAHFEREEDFQDDEVTLLHEAASPYKPVTEPLVHLRVAIGHLIARAIVTEDEGDDVAAELKSVWYAERTVRGMIDAFERRRAASGASVSALLRAELADFQRFRIKTRDLERCLAEKPWSRK